MIGELDILNCGKGHMEIRFDKEDAIETARASRVIQDMLARGYALFIEGADKKLTRVESFDEKQGAYIIADSAKQPAKKGPGRPRAALPMHEAKAVAVGRSAGG